MMKISRVKMYIIPKILYKNTFLLSCNILLFFILCSCNNVGSFANKGTISNSNKLHMPQSIRYNSQSYEDLVELKFAHETGPLDGITPGVGWSSDASHIAPMECFSPLQVIRDGNMATIRAAYITDFDSLIDTLGFSADLKLGYSMFGTNDTFKFINSLSSNKLALSFTFAETISRNVNIKYSPILTKLLNQDGKDVYNDVIANPMFRLFCGDKLVSSYQEGAIVILSMQIRMNNVEQKRILQGSVGLNVHSFAELSAAIDSVKNHYHLEGSVDIVGFQLGGEEYKLSEFLNSNIVHCDLSHIDACKDSIMGAIDYVSHSLPTQFSTPSAYTPIGGLNTSWDLADDLQMKLSPSFVTEDVKNIRQQLVQLKNQQDFNYFHLMSAATAYPGTLIEDIQNQLLEYSKIAHDNVDTLRESVDCWLMPNRCGKIRDKIFSSLKSFPDKNILKGFFGINLYVPHIANSSFSAQYYSNTSLSTAFSAQCYLGGNHDVSLPFHPIDGSGKADFCDPYYGSCNLPYLHVELQGHSTDPGHGSPVNFIYGRDGNKVRWINDKGETYFWDAQLSRFDIPDISSYQLN